MSDEVVATPVIEDVSINKLFGMAVELVKRNPLITFLVICLIGVIIYYFINVRPFKGSSFTHDHEHYHHVQPQKSKQQIERELMEQHIMQQQAQMQQQPQMQQKPQIHQQPQIMITRNETRQLPNDLIQNPLEQVKQPVKVLTDTSEDDLYDVVNDEGMELNVNARPRV